MKVRDLYQLLHDMMPAHSEDEIRIGDQLGIGPYYHDRVGGVWTSDRGPTPPRVILCAEDTDWKDELEGNETSTSVELPRIWTPPGHDKKE